MKMRSMVLAGLALVVVAGSVRAEKPLKDYSFIRGVNYGMMGNQATLEKELGYAKRLNLNSTRIWLSYRGYERDPQGFINQLRNYIRTSYKLGFTTMPILFNGNGLDPETLKPEFRAAHGDAYVKAVVEGLKDEPGLLMWDVMNEPFTNDYHDKASKEELPRREAEITAFLRYYIPLVKKYDAVNAVTVGYTFSSQLEPTSDLVDVLSFHNYTETRASVEAVYKIAEDLSKKTGKPILNSETGCIARANPYDMVIEIAQEHKTGWYIFNLMISGYWGEIHGIFYPDGTIRDPQTVAAIMGFFVNRDLKTTIKPVPNREGQAQIALKQIEDALNEPPSIFTYSRNSTDKLLDAAEDAANLLEAAQMVPMYEPPTARIRFWREQAPDKRDREAIRVFAYELGQTLKKYCQLY